MRATELLAILNGENNKSKFFHVDYDDVKRDIANQKKDKPKKKEKPEIIDMFD